MYLAFAAAAIAGPGIAIQRIARVPVDAALVLPLGVAAAAGSYWLSLVAGAPWLFPAIVLLLDLALVWRAAWRRADGPALRGAVAPLAAVVLVLAATQYPWNRLSSDGEFLLDPLVPYDTAFHVGLARELTLGYA